MHQFYKKLGTDIAKKMFTAPIARLALTQGHLSTSSSSSLASILNSRKYTSITQGRKYTPDFKNYCKLPNGEVVSYFHDIPLEFNKQDGTVNMVVEIPRWTNAKFEINTKIEGNPITQDIKKGKVRFVNNIFPHHGYMHNYGAIPQTWEDPTVKNSSLDLFGDGDPLDVIEIGSQILELGQVKKVKILGSLALIDDGELDWKIVVINVEDEASNNLNDIEDVYKQFPQLLEETRRWFKLYKLPTGKPENTFAFDGEYKSKLETLEIIEECHQSWKNLINGKTDSKKISTKNSTIEGSIGYTNFQTLSSITEENLPDTEIPSEVDKIYYY
ncbi:hypothetical protein PACTADRAFT_48638 [Pachysolen tannophilus NRRL Y-2460]|uniref:inorganic diphosphatase n=1 Tax=Pachysolen tannophilus NRRL Y-2460 TaxID=669874 RepID=A0A1E4TYL0_PACTA|nr:hypothetical protein PACTADRAFT_48638 [Pachysolen tannophilus NRRL Y-2460]